MRLVLHNPQSNSLVGRPLIDVLVRTHSFQKYNYILKYSLKKEDKIIVFVDKNGSSFPTYLSKYVPMQVELFLWAIINKINPRKITILKKYTELKKDDIFLSFALGNLNSEGNSTEVFLKSTCLKLLHLTHFVQRTATISKNIKKYNIDFLVCENNLAKNSKYFKHFFSSYKKSVYYLPFVFQERFNKSKEYSKRINKCVATGTIIRIKEFTMESTQFEDFYSFFKTQTIHPMREQIFKKKKGLAPFIDSYIANFWETKRKDSELTKGTFERWFSRFFNAFFASRRSYFKFNIVEKYNEYKMFITPEEINDLPGIGFVEGMACGTAYIGKRDDMYKDLGMIDKVHYISYDGTIADLKKKIAYYQKHSAELEKIATNGMKFIRAKCNGEFVAKTFYSDLKKLATTYKKNNYKKEGLRLRCSFVT